MTEKLGRYTSIFNFIKLFKKSLFFLFLGLSVLALLKYSLVQTAETKQKTGISHWFNVTTYENVECISGGLVGTIFTSADGKTWTKQNSGTNNDLFDITYGNNKFVTVGYKGTILTSFDGITWSKQNSGINNDLIGIAYGNNKFVVISIMGTNTNLISKIIASPFKKIVSLLLLLLFIFLIFRGVRWVGHF